LGDTARVGPYTSGLDGGEHRRSCDSLSLVVSSSGECLRTRAPVVLAGESDCILEIGPAQKPVVVVTGGGEGSGEGRRSHTAVWILQSRLTNGWRGLRAGGSELAVGGPTRGPLRGAPSGEGPPVPCLFLRSITKANNDIKSSFLSKRVSSPRVRRENGYLTFFRNA